MALFEGFQSNMKYTIPRQKSTKYVIKSKNWQNNSNMKEELSIPVLFDDRLSAKNGQISMKMFPSFLREQY